MWGQFAGRMLLKLCAENVWYLRPSAEEDDQHMNAAKYFAHLLHLGVYDPPWISLLHVHPIFHHFHSQHFHHFSFHSFRVSLPRSKLTCSTNAFLYRPLVPIKPASRIWVDFSWFFLCRSFFLFLSIPLNFSFSYVTYTKPPFLAQYRIASCRWKQTNDLLRRIHFNVTQVVFSDRLRCAKDNAPLLKGGGLSLPHVSEREK